MRFFTAFLLVFLLMPCARAEFEADARAAVLIEAKSGRVLYAKNADEPLPMASTTKIMTCLVALENAKLTDIVTAGANAEGVAGTSIYLRAGESLTMEQLLYAIMLRSGNDAAVAIAEHIAGDADAFASMMNARAANIGADAVFRNPHGLDARGHGASALGMALIMREAMKNEDFRRITATKSKVIPWEGNEYSRLLTNKNRLLTSYEGATGGKTGYTSSAGRCLVFSAEKDGMELIGVVLNCGAWFDTASAMLDYGFENFRSERVFAAGEIVCHVPVDGGQAKRAALAANEDFFIAIEIDEPWELRFEHAASVAAPVKKGDPLGTAAIYSRGERLAECTLVASEGIPRNDFEAALNRVMACWLLNY